MIEELSKFQCKVCCCQYPQSQGFSICNCRHKFCRSCCLQHIESRISSFQKIKCLDNSCNKSFGKQSQIYKQIPVQSKRKMEKFEQLSILQSNSSLKPCHKQQCIGVINSRKDIRIQNYLYLTCNLCRSEHCPNCLKLTHSQMEKCKQNNINQRQKQQKLMLMLKFRRCPSCSVWVQKNGGCQYLTCKCRTQFCFNCGERFETDPCRKLSFTQSQRKIWKLFKQFNQSFKKPQSLIQYIGFLPKSILKLLLILIFTSFYGIFSLGLLFGVIMLLIFLISPAAIIVLVGQFELENKLVILLRVLAVLFYPVVGAVTTVIAFFLFLTYPLMRSLLQTHIYDEFDRFIFQVSEIYLRGINCILSL